MIEAVALFGLFFGLIRLAQLAFQPPKPRQAPPRRFVFSDFVRSAAPLVIRDVQINSHPEAVADVLNPAAAHVRISDSLLKRVTR